MSEQRARILRDLAARFGVRGTARGDDEIELEVSSAIAADVLDTLLGVGAEPLAVWGDDGPFDGAPFDGAQGRQGRPTVHHLVGLGGENLRFVITQRPAAERPELASFGAAHPSFVGGEREIAESLGVVFTDHPDPRPLRGKGAGAPLTVVHGAGVSSLRIGPVGPGAAIEESTRVQLAVVGDRIVHAEALPGVKHRAVEARVKGLLPRTASAVIERICGRCSLANTAAFADAVERMSSAELPRRAAWIRTGLLEIERIAAHAESVAAIAEACDHGPGVRRALAARESLLHALEAAFGSRFARGVIIPGGVARDLRSPQELALVMVKAASDLRALVHDLLDLPPVRAQLRDCGAITPQLARELSLTGPVARAAGSRRDVRIAHPYLAYGELKPWAPVHVGGDALARLRVMHEEIEQSATLCEEVCRHLPAGPLGEPIRELPKTQRGIGLVESPRGATLHVVYSGADGRIRRHWMRGASDVNAVAVPIALLDHDILDHPRITSSFALCVACIDR